jgi:hypothetical protein
MRSRQDGGSPLRSGLAQYQSSDDAYGSRAIEKAIGRPIAPYHNDQNRVSLHIPRVDRAHR